GIVWQLLILDVYRVAIQSDVLWIGTGNSADYGPVLKINFDHQIGIAERDNRAASIVTDSDVKRPQRPKPVGQRTVIRGIGPCRFPKDRSHRDRKCDKHKRSRNAADHGVSSVGGFVEMTIENADNDQT